MKTDVYRKHITLQDKIILTLYSLYLILKPFYLWRSGLPQVADIIMLMLIIFFVIKKRGRFKYSYSSKKFLGTGLVFVAYVLFANTLWMIRLNSTFKFVITSSFYIYNYLVSILITLLCFDYEEKVIVVTYKATLVSLVIQLLIYIIGGGFSGSRMVIGFNNPNQLGYYSLLSLSILIISSKILNINFKWFIVGVIISAILCFSSLSKAAIVSYIIMFIFYILFTKKSKRLKKEFTIFLLVFSGVFTYMYNYTSLVKTNTLYLSVHRRISSIGKDSDDSLGNRGYYRITEHPEYWIFGSGEGDNDRFEYLQGGEFHSTLGNIQVSYGIIGLLLFISYMFIALKASNFKNWYVLFSLMLYGVTHNGIRNSMLWILLSVMSLQCISFGKNNEDKSRFILDNTID